MKRPPFFELVFARHFFCRDASCAPALDLTPHFFESTVGFHIALRGAWALVEQDESRWPGAGHSQFFLTRHVFWRKPPPFAQSGAFVSSTCRKLVGGFTGPAGRGVVDFLPGGGRFFLLVLAPSLRPSGLDFGHCRRAPKKRGLMQLEQVRGSKLLHVTALLSGANSFRVRG